MFFSSFVDFSWQIQMRKSIISAYILIVLTLIQTKEDPGLSSTITGSSTNNFYEKNKSRTKEGKQKKWTVILSVVFVVLTIALGIVYMA